MSYDIYLCAKVEAVDELVEIADVGNITYNVRELIEKSSGWSISNGCNGATTHVSLMLERGIYELEENPRLYKQFEAKNGWGTVEETLQFFKAALEIIKCYPFAYVHVC